MTSPLLLVDGSSYLYRAYHATPAFENSKGHPVAAMTGMINMMRRLYREQRPERVAVVFDAKGNNFRHDLYPEYKANRPPMPDDLALQIDPIHAIVRSMGFPVIVVEGVEADDVIGTLAVQAFDAGLDTLISTGDKDMAQLVNGRVTLINTMTGVTMDTSGVLEKFGVMPDKIIDFLALMGDKVDNIPGVDGVGDKTAAKLLNKYGTLSNIIDSADEIKLKLGEKLRTALPLLPLSYELATIKTDLELETPVDELLMSRSNLDEMLSIAGQYELRSWEATLIQRKEAMEERMQQSPSTPGVSVKRTLSLS